LIQRGRGFVLAAGRYLPSAATAESDLSHSAWLGRRCTRSPLSNQAEIIGADMTDVLFAMAAMSFVMFLIAIAM
jgi:hypothetical protein